MGVAEGCQSVLLLWNGERGHNLPHVSAGGAGSTPDDPSSAGLFFFAVAAALAVFSYLYSAKSTNMMHALPVNRLELYVTNYLSGLIFLIVPEIITFFITVLVCLANQFTCIQYLFAALLAQAGVTFFAYSLAVFVAMFTGQAFAMPCYYVIVNYLYVGCMFIVAKVIETISYGIENAWNPGKKLHFIATLLSEQ